MSAPDNNDGNHKASPSSSPNYEDYTSLSALLLLASKMARPAVVRALLKSSADICARDADGNTALLISAAYGNLKVVKMLVRAGADLNACNSTGAGRSSKLKIFSVLKNWCFRGSTHCIFAWKFSDWLSSYGKRCKTGYPHS